MSKLKNMMVEKGITQEELGLKINTKQPNVSYVVTNGIKTVRTARKYCKALNCNILDLLEF